MKAHDVDAAPDTTDVVIAGGGPGGMMLAYLLGRAGIAVTLLEAHHDFDRDFRGDSLHPYTLELCDQLGLADRLLALPHQRAVTFRLHTPRGVITTAAYDQLSSRFNYVALMPQAVFLDFLAARLTALPGCRVHTGHRVIDLIRDNQDRVTGVRYRHTAGVGTHRAGCGAGSVSTGVVSARLVVGADGRFSRMRRLADLPAHSLGATTDLLWFRLPHRPGDPADADADAELYFGRDHYVALLTGTAGWQVGYALAKGEFAAARAAGVEPIRRFVAHHVPWLADRVHLLTDFSQITLLSVEIARVARWWRPGLLLLGDAAHVISPVGGNGILMAIQDAVAAANHLVPALRARVPTTAAGADRCTGAAVSDDVLAAIQAAREPAIRQVQAQQVRIDQRLAAARAAGKPITPPRLLGLMTALPGFRRRAAATNAYGPTPPRLDPALLAAITA